MRLLFELFERPGRDDVEELSGRIACHDRDLLAVIVRHHVVRLIGEEVIIHHELELSRSLSEILKALIPDELGRKRSCLLQRHDTEILAEELVPLLLGLLERQIVGPVSADGEVDAGAALRDGSLYAAVPVKRRDHLAQSAASACGLAEDGHVLRISSEVRNVSFDPVDPGFLVEQSEVCAVLSSVLCADLGVGKQAEHVRPVVDRDEDHSSSRKALSVELHLSGVSSDKSSAEYPYHDRKPVFRGLCGSPDIEMQTVLAHREIHVPMPFFLVERTVCPGVIRHVRRAVFQTVAHTFPGFYGLRDSPAVLSDRRRCKRYSLEYRDGHIAAIGSAHKAAFCFRDLDHVMLLPFIWLS